VIGLLGDELRSGPLRPDLVVVLAGSAALHHSELPDLLARGPAAGLRFVCAETDERRLPDGTGARLVATGRDAVLRVGGGEARSLVPDGITAGTAERVARSLAPLRVEPAAEPSTSLRRAVALRSFDVAPPSHAPPAAPTSRPET
jgi:S-DNA-T family DNA segregation ATPase FtsK/SpoIIIE